MDRNTIVVVVTAAIIVLVMLVPGIGNNERLIVMVIGLALILFMRRGTLSYGSANKKMMKKDPSAVPQALEQYKKALKAGIPYNAMVTTGSILIHNGEIEEGKAALEKVIGKCGSRSEKEKKLQIDARTSLSMAYWLKGDNTKAISLCEEAYELGGRNNNLYVNLSTYYLAEGDVKAFMKLEKEFRKDEKLKSPALRDLQAVALMLQGNWKGASEILGEMLKEHSYTFVDPYIHMAQVRMHYGNSKEALKWVKAALERCTFLQVAVIRKPCVEELERLLSSEESAEKLMAANEADPLALINGRIPTETDQVFTFSEDPEEDSEETVEEVPDEDVSTDLTDDDEEWARRHGY